MNSVNTRTNRHPPPFLACLLDCSPDEARNQKVTFQTFTDPPPKPSPDPLARIIHGTLDNLAPELDRMNQDGAGVFVTVNQTDFKGRSKGNIRSLRGWHADIDAKDSTPPFDERTILESLPLAPSMVVRTPGGLHLYWLALEPMPCLGKDRRTEHEDELRAIARALAPFGADAKACTVERVLRLPGFLHRKADPTHVDLVTADGPRYARDQVRAAFPPIGRQKCKPETEPKPPRVRTSERGDLLGRAAKYLDTLPPGKQGENGSGATFAAALKIQDGFNLTEAEALDLLLEHFNPRCEPPWTKAELLHKVKDAAPMCRERGHLVKEDRRASSGSPSPEGCWPADEEAPPAPERTRNDGRPEVPGFEWKAKGLYKAGTPEKAAPSGDMVPGTPASWIAPPFTLPGLVRDAASHGWRLLIAWNDLDGRSHEESLPFELMSGEGTELARTLGQGGMLLSPAAGLRKVLLNYLVQAARQVRKRVRLVETLGWQDGGAFVLPDGQTIGRSDEPVRYAEDLPGTRSRGTAGTLQGWKDGVSRYAVGNPRLAFAISCAFAGPLLDLVRPDGGGGFNLQGFSSKGKSTCLEAAASVWSSPAPLPTWRSTANGLEGLAAPRNDGFLVLDELSQVDAKEAGSSAYLLANGSAKARATREGGNRPMKQWRIIFLSSGEQGLEDKLSEDGKRTKAGQEVRVPDIPCPASGMFEHAHGMASMGAFAENLKAQARKNYGHAAAAFLKNLCDEWSRRDALQAKLRAMEASWLASVLPPGADPQVRRVAGRFALVAVAGELAQRMGILPWPEGDAERAAEVCFKAWLDRRGFTGASETHRGIAAVLAFMEKHGQARFDEWGITEPRTLNRAGTRKRAEAVDGWDYFFTTDGWKEACLGFTARDVARACADAGLLEPGEGGKLSRSVKIQGHGNCRCYVIRALAVARFNDSDAA